MASVHVPPEHILYAEIVSVIAAMRKNSRWASYARSARLERGRGRVPAEVSLFIAFEELKREIGDSEDILTLPLPTLLSPFLMLLQSPFCPSTITVVALTSIYNLLRSPIVRTDSPELSQGLSLLSTALAKCKFEPTDSTSDEVLQLKQLDVILEVLTSDVGTAMGNPEACELLECVLGMCYQTKLSDMLRRSAEYTMHRLIRKVYAKLEKMDPEEEERELEREEAEFKLASGVKGTPQAAQPSEDVTPEDASAEGTLVNGDANETTPLAAPIPLESLGAPPRASPTPVPELNPPKSPNLSSIPSPPYSLITHQSLIVALISLLSPHPPSPPHRTLTTLSLFHTLLTSSPRIPAFPSLFNPLLDTGCRNLFWLIRSDHPGVQTLSLKVVTALLEIFRDASKGAYQRELFLTHCLDRLQPPSSPQSRPPHSPSPTPSRAASPSPAQPNLRPPGWIAKGDTRLLLLSAIAQLSRRPGYMVEVFVNCDCDAGSEDMFEKLISFLTAEVNREEVGMEGIEGKEMCVEMLLAYVSGMWARSEGAEEPWPSTYPEAASLLHGHSRKRLLKSGSTMFNTKPRLGLAFFEEQGFIYADPSEPKPLSLAKFLKGCQRLDKKVLGEYLGKEGNEEILEAYLGLFDFDNKAISEALREVLETFRLPGEAQPIGRITEVFARKYRSSRQKENIRSDDAAYVLAYSVILLNTDLHSPQNRKKRMTLEQYEKNLRGVNDGVDFSGEYLASVYDTIKKHEIIMPEEHVGQAGFDYAWKELMIRSKTRGPLMIANSSALDSHLFSMTWKPVVSAIVHAFVQVDDDHLIQRIITGLRHCASLASKFEMPEIFDYIVGTVADATGLILDEDPRDSAKEREGSGNYPVVQVDEARITVSPVSIGFGRNFKGQLAAVVLFTIATSHVELLRDEWTQVFEILKTLFLHSMLPRALLEMEDFLSGATVIPLKGSSLQPAEEEHRTQDTGLLSTLSSYLLTPYGSSAETMTVQPTAEDVDNTMSALDCINTCNLDRLYSALMELSGEPLLSALRGLQAAANQCTIDKLDPRTLNRMSGQLPYDPASVFFLEVMVSVALRRRQYMSDIWDIIFEYISGILKHSDKFSVLLVERAVVGLLKLCEAISEDPKLHDQLYLAFDLLGELAPPVKAAVGEQLMIGLERIIKKHISVITSQTEWRIVLALLRPMVIHAEAAKVAFGTVRGLIMDDGVTMDNFGILLVALQDFTNAAGAAVSGKQQHIRRNSAAEGASLDAAVPRGMQAVELIFEMKKFVPTLAEGGGGELGVTDVWEVLWLPLLNALQNQALNTSRDVRHSALSHLQRLILMPNVEDSVSTPTIVFDRIVFPLLDELLKPQVYLKDPHGMSETRLRACNLLCKSFLHYGIKMHDSQQRIDALWLRIVDYLDHFMNSGKRDQLYEAVPESLKNVVLVLHASSVLLPPWESTDPYAQTLWDSTRERMDRFLPSFLDELLPEPAPKPLPVTQPHVHTHVQT